MDCSNNTNKLSPQERTFEESRSIPSSNNTNKLSPQEPELDQVPQNCGSNNTNKLSPQERIKIELTYKCSSNNTNKLSPQERDTGLPVSMLVQIIQINLVLKNWQVKLVKCLKFK